MVVLIRDNDTDAMELYSVSYWPDTPAPAKAECGLPACTWAEVAPTRLDAHRQARAHLRTDHSYYFREDAPHE
jgi:hypothetical protein